MVRAAVIAGLAAVLLAAPARAQEPALLMPGVTYERRIEFTRHGPVVLHVIEAPRPGGLHALRPVLSNDSIVGREKVTSMQKRVGGATVAGVNGDLFFAGDGRPHGLLVQGGVMQASPLADRSSIGVDAQGALQVARVEFFATWRGTGQRRPFQNLNRQPGGNGFALFTPAWGPRTPLGTGAVEAALEPFPSTTPGTDITGTVVRLAQGGFTEIPPGGAVLSARGAAAGRLAAEAPVGAQVTVRITLQPDWSKMVEGVGGGPVLVRDGRAVFRAFEAFPTFHLLARLARTAVGQRRDGRILLVSVDGGQRGYSSGMTNFELAQAMVRLGAVNAAGLDAGGSTAMAFDGELLNRPSDPAGERAVADGLFVFYYGVHAPPAAERVVSPNGDGIGERQTVVYKLARGSAVNARLFGPDGAARFSDEASRPAGVYRFSFGDEVLRTEGRWRWVVTAQDDLGRRSTAERTFWVNSTLGFLRVQPALLRVGPAGAQLVATFRLSSRARVTATVKTVAGASVQTVVRREMGPGDVSIRWNGRDGSGAPVFSGRYVLRVTTENRLGPAELETPFTVRRVAGRR